MPSFLKSPCSHILCQVLFQRPPLPWSPLDQWLVPSPKVLSKWFTDFHESQTLHKSSVCCTSHNFGFSKCNFCEDKELALILHTFPKLFSTVVYIPLGFNDCLNSMTLNTQMREFLANWSSPADHLFTPEELLVLLL